MLPMASSSLPMSSSSSSSATVAVDKATSDLLISPDWTMNMDICDSVNSHHWHAKDVVKALKRRLQHKNPRVQLLSLTLLETMVKNCADYLHFEVAERNILGEMIKIVKKKADMQVREKILVLLDSWQEAFGGPGGKYPQYYWAYEELKRSGVEFPKRVLDTSPIFTPPASHPPVGRPQPGFGMPSNASRRLDETMATEIESLSLSSLEAMRNVSELLGDMLQAVNPSDRAAVKDEVIVELVNRCRTNQKKLMQMLTSTGDEELLARGLDLNDGLQTLLARHDAIASGSPLPAAQLPSSSPPQITNSSPQRAETSASVPIKQSEVRDSSPNPNVNTSAPVTTITRSQMYEEEEEEDEFAQLARRHTKAPPAVPQMTSNGTSAEGLAIVSLSTDSLSSQSSLTSNALALPDPPAPVKTKEQDIIDFLSITLSTTGASPHTPHTPSQLPPNQNTHQPPTNAHQAYPHAPQPTYSGVQAQVPYQSYVVPWAQQPQQQAQLEPPPPPQPQPPTYSSAYPPPPWAATPGYYSNPSSYAPLQADPTTSHTTAQTAKPLQSYNSFMSRENGFSTNGESRAGTGVRNATMAAPTSQKPFVPSYRLFEDLNVFGNADGRMKMPSGNGSSSLAGPSGQSMVGGRK